MSRRRALVGGLLAGALFARPAGALGELLTVQQRPVESLTLANGLQVVVLPSRRAPIVTQLLIYKVGSADEVAGQTGLAHFLEHMMFKGTTATGPGDFSRLVARTGGRDNAFTDFDVTGYYQTVAADQLELVMRLEADRMANLRLSERELVPERQVVLEERRMRVENSPAALLGEAVRDQLFGHRKPYGMPTSGLPEDPATAGLELAVNVSARQFHQSSFVEMVRNALMRSGAPARRLKLELTESLLLQDVDDTVRKMNLLKVACHLEELAQLPKGYLVGS